MDKVLLFNNVSFANSKTITEKYSTSFASAIRLLKPSIHAPIYGIYGFVRLADEIVDSFQHVKQQALLEEFKAATYKSIEDGFSINPILNSFQLVINEYKIEHHLIESFFNSMEQDLHKTQYHTYAEYSGYIYGSAEAVGLMCLNVFCKGDKALIAKLTTSAKALGSAFQKINFLRDLKEDFHLLNRSYFPGIDLNDMNEESKNIIIKDIQNDFKIGLEGIEKLPLTSRLGVYVAYKYYYSLFKKIKQLPAKVIKNERVRVPDYNKLIIVFESFFRYKLHKIA